jgi:hypothetical protein
MPITNYVVRIGSSFRQIGQCEASGVAIHAPPRPDGRLQACRADAQVAPASRFEPIATGKWLQATHCITRRAFRCVAEKMRNFRLLSLYATADELDRLRLFYDHII